MDRETKETLFLAFLIFLAIFTAYRIVEIYSIAKETEGGEITLRDVLRAIIVAV